MALPRMDLVTPGMLAQLRHGEGQASADAAAAHNVVRLVIVRPLAVAFVHVVSGIDADREAAVGIEAGAGNRDRSDDREGATGYRRRLRRPCTAR